MTSTRRLFGLLAAITALGVSGCTSGSAGTPTPTTVYLTAPPLSTAGNPLATTSPAPPARSTAAATTTKAVPVGAPVGVLSTEDDGVTYGVGMPLIIRFTKSPTDKAAFEKAVKVTVNGRPVAGAWFWERVLAGKPLEAHYRPRNYWPHHSKIHVALPIKGVSAGKGLTFSNNLSLDYAIGAYHVSRVDATSLRMTVYGDTGKAVKLIKVSLGSKKHPTQSGVKVVIGRENPAHMVGDRSDPYHVVVPNSVKISQDGEYVHPASWNHHIGQTSTSHGCTNISVADGAWFYRFSQVGDVVEYPETDGKPMPTWDGYGDWNPNWATWTGGGAL